MAKGQMKSNKEVRKPKKDAKKPAAAATAKGGTASSQAEGQIGSLSARSPALAPEQRPGVLPTIAAGSLSLACLARGIARVALGLERRLVGEKPGNPLGFFRLARLGLGIGSFLGGQARRFGGCLAAARSSASRASFSCFSLAFSASRLSRASRIALRSACLASTSGSSGAGFALNFSRSAFLASVAAVRRSAKLLSL